MDRMKLVFSPLPVAHWLALILWCWGVVGTPCLAKMIYSGDRVRIDVSVPVEVGNGAESLWMFTLTATGLEGARVGGWDGEIVGPLHHQTVAGFTTPTLSEPIVGTVLATDLDSHFRVHDGGVLAVAGPWETYAQRHSNEPPNATGPGASQATVEFGSTMGGTFALVGTAPFRWDVAQLVAPRGSMLTLELDIGFGGPDAPPPESLNFPVALDDTWLVEPLCGDLDDDRDVDSADLLDFVANWTGAQSEPLTQFRRFDQGDCDLDGDVDTPDLLGLLEHWSGAGGGGGLPSVPAASLAGYSMTGSGGVSAAIVPEPAGLSVRLGLGLALAHLLGWSKRRRSGASV